MRDAMTPNFSSAVFGFLFGIWFASLFSWGFAVVGLVLWFALIFFVRRFWLIAFCCLFFAFGVARVELSLLNQNLPTWHLEQVITVEGVVAEEAKPGATTNQVILETPEKYRLLLITDLYPEYQYGEKLKVSGKLARPENFLTDSGREFDYVNYLGRREIYFEMFRPNVEVLSTNEGYWFARSLIWLRGEIISGISSVLPEPQAGLLGGLLIGARQSLDREILEQFRRVGLSHMVVLSGYNLTIVAEAIRAVLGFLPLYAGLSAAGGGIILFALLAGGGAAVWRATLMALLALVARATGRVYEVTRALVVTIILLLIWDPSYLVFDLGFQLSILATLGLLFLSSLIKKWFGRVPERFGLREILASTIAAQIAVLPWLLYKIGDLSLVSFVVNPLVLIVVPMIMLFGFPAGLFSFFSTWLAFIPGSIAYLLLSYQLAIVAFFSKLSFATVTISSFPLIIVVAIYGLYFYWYYRSKHELVKVSH